MRHLIILACMATAMFAQRGLIGLDRAPAEKVAEHIGTALNSLAQHPGAVEAPERHSRGRVEYDLPLDESGRRQNFAILGDTVAYKDATGSWKPVHPVLRKIPSGWELTGTGVQVLVRPSGNATILGQYYVDPDTGVQDWLELDFPKVDYKAGMQFSYTHGSLPWTLLVEERGYTFESGPISTRGNRTFSYSYESSRPLTVDADGGVTSPAPLRISRAVMVGADGVRYPCGAWVVDSTALSSTCSDAALPDAAMPYHIDPSTTVTVYKSSQGTMSGVKDSLTSLRWSSLTNMSAVSAVTQTNEEGFPVAWRQEQPVIRFATPYPAGSVTSASLTLVRDTTFTNISGCSLRGGYVDDRAFSDANLPYFWYTNSNPIGTNQAFYVGDLYGAYDYGAITSKTFTMEHLGLFGTSVTTIRMYLSCYDFWGDPYYHAFGIWGSTSMSVTYYANTAPATVSVSGVPANVPYGTSFNLAATVRDADGRATINYWHLLMNYGVDGSYACYFLFNHRANTIQLNSDAGGNWGTAYTMGSANTLANSQCQVDVANSNFTYPNSTDVTANLRLMFRSNAITRNPIKAYLWAQDLNGAIANWSGPHATTTVVAPLTISTTALPGGIVGSSYSQTLVTTGGIPGYLWSIASGSLPSGISLGSNGTISGTPTAAGTASFTVRATDSMTPTPQTATQTLTISVVSALSITTSALSGGVAGTAYSQTLNATGGTPGYTWSLASGSLPSGLSLAANGTISGTPTGSGTWNFTVLATDATSPTPQTTTKALAITIVPALSISTASLPNGQVSGAYSQALSASGGTAPYNWAIIGGALPAGLTLNADNGAITGTPTTAGTSSVTFRATDSTSPTAQIADRGLSITIAPPPPPPAASLSGPGNGMTGQALVPTLVWTPVAGATAYDVYLGANNPPALAASNVGGTSYIPGAALATSTLYFWKIVAKNSGGSSPDSAIWSFTTVPPPPPAVSLAMPANGATAQALSPTLEWSGVAEATAYDVYLGTSNPPALAAANVVGTSYTPSPALGTSVVYYWKVVAKNSGGSSPDSATWSFTTVPPAPAAVSLSAPANGATAQPVSPTLTWATAAGATSYDMYLGSSNPPALVASNISGTSYTPGTALSQETLYYWKVVAKNPGGASPDSASWSFTTVPPPPSAVSLAAPADGATHQILAPALTWSATTGATAYDVYLGTSNPPSLAASNLGGTTYTSPTLNAGTAYFWKIVAKNAGGTAPDSAIWSFTTGTPPPAVTLSVPTNSATDQALSPTLTWMPATGATSYDVYLGASNPPALLASNVAGNSYVPGSALTPGTAYSWKIVARNSDGASPDSAVWSFSTVPAPPPAV
ncbi:MAG TPA: putative Ig domain-containing protein, partial [Clostridia bacterium]|nr:putative Ig domain-containing protein [Clostridia bacterium]